MGPLVYENENESGGDFIAWERPEATVKDLHEMLGRGQLHTVLVKKNVRYLSPRDASFLISKRMLVDRGSGKTISTRVVHYISTLTSNERCPGYIRSNHSSLSRKNSRSEQETTSFYSQLESRPAEIDIIPTTS